jgi:uncharacterized protein (TIGR03067 family)
MRPVTLAALALFFAPSAWGGDPKPKEGAQAEAVAKELKRLEGTWELVSLVVDGKKVDRRAGERVLISFRGDGYKKLSTDSTATRGVLKVDPSGKPKTLAMTPAGASAKGQTVLGAYELKGDQLRWCVAQRGGPLPAEMTSEPGSKRNLFTYRRVKDEKK